VPYSHLHLIDLARIIGDNDLAIQKAEEAIKILPELEPQIRVILGINESEKVDK
jgi:hypothetical protein